MGLQAIILIGGEGTRLRPLTLDLPKPLLPVCNRPFLSYQFELLRRHGIRDVILCTAYGESVFRKAFGDGRKWGVRLRYVHEKKPLGTGGGVKNAENLVRGTTLVLNGDCFHDMDMRSLVATHRKRKADATIALTPVEDPTRYGLVELASDGRVKRFVEKPSPQEITTDTINAGVYVFEPKVFGRIPDGVVYSVERGLFPSMLSNGSRLFGWVNRGYWLDIGTMESYLRANEEVLFGRTPHRPSGRRVGAAFLEAGAKLPRDTRVEGRAAIGSGTRIGPGVVLRGAVSIGPGCVIDEGALIEDSVLLEKVRVGVRAQIKRSAVGRGSSIGRESSLSDAALGAGAVVPAFSKA